MNTFTWLLLGHLVGDWVLQNDWMAKGKKTKIFALPGLVHYLVYTAAILVTLWAAGLNASPLLYAGVGLVTFCTHLVIDPTDLIDRWMRFFGQTINPTVRLMVDQTAHLLILMAITLWVSGATLP